MDIEKMCEENGLGKVINITKLTGGLLHKMYKVETDKDIYAIKVLNQEVMNRKDAYDNFITSEKISNLAKENGIPVSSALKLNENFIIEYQSYYFMVFNFIDGNILKDEEITVKQCKKIGQILSNIHSLNYNILGLNPDIKEESFYVDWESFINNNNFDNMSYKNLYLNNYRKYYSILRRTLERFNEINKEQTICHKDMDPKNVMWSSEEAIVIDWESSSLANPYQELLEVALSWSGFLSNNFDERKFTAVIDEYSKNKDISNEDWYFIICGNLIGRFSWLEYNLKRSLGIITNDEEEKDIAQNEVSKTIDEINRYLELIGTLYDIFHKLLNKKVKEYDEIIKKIISTNNIFSTNKYQLITAGFTNTIYSVDNYVVRICTDYKNEERFKNEIEFYKANTNNKKLPTLYIGDTSKEKVPYYYQIMEKINGKTLYEVWYKLSKIERKNTIIEIINILKTFHNIKVESYDFTKFLKEKISSCIGSSDLMNELFDLCDRYFKTNKFGVIHGDLHFDNFIYNNGRVTLLDFERYMIAPIDYDFRIFARYKTTPWLWASERTDMLTVEDDYQELMSAFIDNYKELSEIPYLEERLKIYEIIEILREYKNTSDKGKLELASRKIKYIK